MTEDTAIITVRVPKKVKIAMNKANINISKEIRDYLEAKTRSLELYALLPEISKRAKNRKVTLNSTRIIRKYRDSR
ncbi:Phd family antitoxin [Candidatus Mancarchaeum acidiphilum]|uniref:Phd family antitoxin n=1 Tax=Candidatus Mancarchaeum acidiphilum TaxID=1920749 RepID=A0A218NMT9_9ARCH|nr:hypothetical protein [Candidatus Mancarchaeum acidiphilum]ASI13782.1 Phd family antitoxin [Candidatus Mancarchaeum acidiphilum]